MRTHWRLLWVAALAGTAFAAAKEPPRRDDAPPVVEDTTFEVLRPGTYVCEVSGLLCEACSRVIAETVSQVKGVQKASMDFPSRQLTLVVADNRTVRAAVLRKALKKAARRIDLGTEFRLTKVRYVP